MREHSLGSSAQSGTGAAIVGDTQATGGRRFTEGGPTFGEDLQGPEFTIDNPALVTFQIDRETRTIRGLALPFGDVAESAGRRWQFGPGTLTWAKVKVLDGHDWTRAVGTAELEETAEGIVMAARIARGPRGDEVLALAEDGVYDGLSVGLANDVKAALRDGIHHATSGTVREVSLTPLPAFTRAQVTSVAASAAPKEGSTMPDNETGEVEASVSFTADQGKALNDRVAELADQFKAMQEMKAPVAQAQFTVTEEPIYRFHGTETAPSGHDFATDLYNAARNGDHAAFERVKRFTGDYLLSGPTFVDSTDVSSVNQPVYRPDLFVPQAPVPTSPLFDTFYKGGLASVQPFFYSKLDRTATTVGVDDHVEGIEPTPGDLVTAAGATVTPAPVSGKVHITREVADMGGNPQVSALAWAEFERSFKIALETKTAALIAASAASITSLTAAIPAGATGGAAGAAIEAGLVGLQFIPDGARFTKAFGHVDLYTKLATYENADGELRYPIINPQNRSGITGARYSFIDLAGYRMEPAHSLGATSAAASNSYVADPNAVHVWASGLQRLGPLEERVEGWDLGVFAYFAGIVYDVTGLRKIAYDPVA